MTKKLIIAEKPSVANDLARALGGFTRHGDYFESEEYVLAPAIGHLLELVAPEGVEVKRGKWSFATEGFSAMMSFLVIVWSGCARKRN